MSEKSRCSSPLPTGSDVIQFRSVRSLHEEYRFEEDKDRIGHGAFSVVYRAVPSARTVAMERTILAARAAGLLPLSPSSNGEESSGSLHVAMKVLPREQWDEDKASRQRRDVHQEALTLARVRGVPGCTLLVDTVQTEQQYAIVMLLEDRNCMDCGQYLAVHGKLSEQHASIILFQLLSTLHELHEEVSVLHHDIKLENVVLCGPRPHYPVHLQSMMLLSVSTECDFPSLPLQLSGDDVKGGGEEQQFTELPLPPPPPPPPQAISQGSKSSAPMTTPPVVASDMNLLRSKSACGGGGSPPSSLVLAEGPDDSRRLARVVLIDFGLARQLRNNNNNATQWSPNSSCDRLDALCSSSCPCPLPQSQQQSHVAYTVRVDCCGTDRYLPAELLEMMTADQNPTSLSLSSATTTTGKEMSPEDACKIDSYAIGVLAYLLLSGCFPYGAKTKPQLYRQQRNTPLKMDTAVWRNVSTAAKEWVKGLLCTEVSARWSTSQALRHPWMVEAKQLAAGLHQ